MRNEGEGKEKEKGFVREWAEIVYVQNNLGRKKHGRDYRFLLNRERWNERLSSARGRDAIGKEKGKRKAESAPGDQLYFTKSHIRYLEEELPEKSKSSTCWTLEGESTKPQA